MRKLFARFLVSIVLVTGSITIGIVCSKFLDDFTPLPDMVIQYVGPVVFIIVAFFCSRNVDGLLKGK